MTIHPRPSLVFPVLAFAASLQISTFSPVSNRASNISPALNSLLSDTVSLMKEGITMNHLNKAFFAPSALLLLALAILVQE